MLPTLHRLPLLLMLATLAAGAGGCGGSPPPHRVLVVGWDGATFDLIDPLLEQGRLPHLAALIARGERAPLRSTRIPISSAAWPTMTTGKGPGEHGVYSFFRAKENSYDVRLVSAMDVAQPPIWRVLSGRGHIVNVWGVPLTYPPEPVRGTLVAGMLSPFDADYAHPAGLADSLRETGFVPDVGLWRQDQIADMAEVERQLAHKERAVIAQLERNDWTFSMIVFKSLDVICHRPNLRLAGDEVSGLYERLDAILGAMIEAAGPNTTVLVVSDHGFTEYRRTFDLHRWLIESGWSITRDTVLPSNTASGPLAGAKAGARALRLGALDMPRTRAFADVSEGNFGALRLNVIGREPRGSVARADIDATLAALERDLRMIEFPAGIPLVAETYRGTELYPGPYCDAIVPDLIVELNSDWRVATSVFGKTITVGGPPFPDHAIEGIFVIGGPGVHAQQPLDLSLVDIAPIILHALGEPIPTSMRATPPAGLFEARGAPRRIDDAEDPGMRPTSEVYAGRGAAQPDAAVTHRVHSIGYGG